MEAKSLHKTNNQNYYFLLGIGGIGMSAIAKYLNFYGNIVAGYDAVESDITKALESKGINIIYQDDPQLLPNWNWKKVTIIRSPAVKDSKILTFFEKLGLKIYRRAEFLIKLTKHNPIIAIAGTHGKTTTSAITAHILNLAGLLKAGFVGGIVRNYNSNLILPKTQTNNTKYIVVEADEFDKQAFLELKADYAAVISLEPDHLDVYQDFNEIKNTFIKFLNNAKVKLLNSNILTNYKNALRFSISQKADFYVDQISYSHQKQYFTLHLKDKQLDTYINFPGSAYLTDALAASAIAYLLNVPLEIIHQGLTTYQGTQRRFELKFFSNNKFIYDDYAHHPTELKALAEAVRLFHPDQEITIVFQPHLYSRTKFLAEQFAKALDLFDKVIITDIYPAREQPIPGVDHNLILQNMNNPNKTYVPKEKLVDYLKKLDYQVLIIAGAGDVNQVISKML